MLPYLKSNTPRDDRNEPILIQRDTDFTLFSLMVDCPARTLLGCTVHHVILFEVIYRGIEYILGTNIHPMGDTLAFFFTNHEDSIPFAVDGQITCHADGFQQADLVFGDGILAGVFTSPSTEK